MFTIEDIIRTLEGVEVKGRENLDRLLSAILALEAVVEAQKGEVDGVNESVADVDGGEIDG